jgi:hypothetical protein
VSLSIAAFSDKILAQKPSELGQSALFFRPYLVDQVAQIRDDFIGVERALPRALPGKLLYVAHSRL